MFLYCRCYDTWLRKYSTVSARTVRLILTSKPMYECFLVLLRVHVAYFPRSDLMLVDLVVPHELRQFVSHV